MTSPTATPEHVERCALPSWLPLFKSNTLKTHVIALPQEFVDYLNADGIRMPVDANGDTVIDARPIDADYDSDSDAVWSSSGSSSSGADDTDVHFGNLDAQITGAINALGGAVFPKLDWSSPRDACWIALSNSLKCTRPSDIYLLLKSSDFIAHDLGRRDTGFRLVLRKWYDLHPAMEFRCVVVNGQLVGLSQRDCATFYPFLSPMRDVLLNAIQSFWRDAISGVFFDETNCRL
jgi:hypothetical protein